MKKLVLGMFLTSILVVKVDSVEDNLPVNSDEIALSEISDELVKAQDESLVRSLIPFLMEAAATFLEVSVSKMPIKSPRHALFVTAAQCIAGQYREEAQHYTKSEAVDRKNQNRYRSNWNVSLPEISALAEEESVFGKNKENVVAVSVAQADQDDALVRSITPQVFEAMANCVEHSCENISPDTPGGILVATIGKLFSSVYRKAAKSCRDDDFSCRCIEAFSEPVQSENTKIVDNVKVKVTSPEDVSIILRSFLDHLLLSASIYGEKIVEEFVEEMNLR